LLARKTGGIAEKAKGCWEKPAQGKRDQEIELKKLMFMLNVKYDFLKKEELLNELSNEGIVEKFRKGKKSFYKNLLTSAQSANEYRTRLTRPVRFKYLEK
jgi:predicted transcriptional regulator